MQQQEGYGPAGRSSRPFFQEGKLFLGGLDSQTTQESITEYCSKWGSVVDVVVMENRGFGFVTFKDAASAQRFLETHHHEIDAKQIEAKAALPKRLGGSAQLTKKMFVGGTGEITDEEFRQHFDKYGEIEDAVVVRRDNVSRGFGFVTFKDEMSVEKCLVEAHILPNGRRVDIKRAVPRDQIPYNMPYGYAPFRGRAMMYGPYGPVNFGVGAYGVYGYGMGGNYMVGSYPGRGTGPARPPPY